MPRVFISYSHDSLDHARAVRELANCLRASGFDARIDQFAEDPDEGWPRWMKRELAKADFVLMVPTAAYRRRWDGVEEPGKGLGATWEGLILTNRLYQAGGVARGLRCVLVGEARIEHIPDELNGHSYYQPPEGCPRLDRYLRGLPLSAEAPPLGALEALPAKWDRPQEMAWDRRGRLEGFLVDAFPTWELGQLAERLPDKSLSHALPGEEVPKARFARELVGAMMHRSLPAKGDLWSTLREKRPARADEIADLETMWR